MIDLEKLREQAPYVGLIDDELIELLDHIAQLEKDAGRYRYMRDPHSCGDFSNFYLDDLDQTIDTAMEAKQCKD